MSNAISDGQSDIRYGVDGHLLNGILYRIGRDIPRHLQRFALLQVRNCSMVVQIFRPRTSAMCLLQR